MVNFLVIALVFIFKCSITNACGIAVHNEITHRSLENFMPKSSIEQKYKDDILDSPGFAQAGSFFPDWGYQCLGYNQQSEDAHWPTFIKTAVNYIREVYPVSRFHQDEHVKGLISFVFAIMSHGMADVKWHSLAGLTDYFIVAMANSDFHGDTNDAHLAADAGAEFTLRHSNTLSYLNETWQVPVKDLVEIYERLYSSDKVEKKKVPVASHLKYCMATAFAASKIDVEFGKLMFGYYGSKSPFLTEEMYDYYKGGIEDMSGSVTDCYPELVNAFEHGSIHTSPDTLCASYFYTSFSNSPQCKQNRIKNPNSPSSHAKQLIYENYNPVTGVFTLTADTHSHKQRDRHDDTTLLPIVQSQTPESHEVTMSVRLRLQLPLQQEKTDTKSKKCISVGGEEDITLILPISSASLGHELASGDFDGSGKLDMAVSAPYHLHPISQERTGTVFILNTTVMAKKISESNDIRELSTSTLQGPSVHGRFGWSMATIDFNRDGIDDLAIAAPFGTNSGTVELYLGRLHLGLSDNPCVLIQLQSQPFLPTVLTAIDMDQDGYKDLVIGCPLCPAMNEPQAGIVYIFKSHRVRATQTQPEIITQSDIRIENPNLNISSYDHFGESILIVKDTVLIGSPGYSIGTKQRVGRVYAFDIQTHKLKWMITGTEEFQQYGKVLATDNNEIIAVSSPSERNIIGLQKYWQGGSVRIYDWNKLNNNNEVVRDIKIEHGMINVIKGRTSAGHLGKSLSVFRRNGEIGIWIGEPMSEQENGRVYRWMIKTKEVECIRNQVILARFGSQIGPLGTDAICITSQRYGQNARYSGAVTFLFKGR